MAEVRTIKDVPIGAISTFAKTVSEADVYLFAGITGDLSRNHLNDQYMKGGQYGQRIAHGALMVGFMSAAGAQLMYGRTASVGYDKVRFPAAVFFGDTITTVYTVKEIDEAKQRIFSDIVCTNQHGKVVAVGTHIRAFLGPE